MPLVLVRILEFSFALYLVVIAIEARSGWSPVRSVGGLLVVLAGFLFVRWNTGFPEVRQSFSVTPYILQVTVMYVFVILGMGANYCYHLEEQWSWSAFLKPILISPMVLLPLLGTIGEQNEFGARQLVYLGILAFQNGFFWRAIFKNAKPRK